jgi:hypothetical protein
MPYKVRENDDGKWEVYNPDTGKIYGTHETKEDAEAQKRALYANANPENEAIKVRIKK